MEHKQIKKRIQRMTSGQPVYPALLKEIRDYPKELYYIGDPKLLEEKCVPSWDREKRTSMDGALHILLGRPWDREASP